VDECEVCGVGADGELCAACARLTPGARVRQAMEALLARAAASARR
jgi:hypothetical protein